MHYKEFKVLKESIFITIWDNCMLKLHANAAILFLVHVLSIQCISGLDSGMIS